MAKGVREAAGPGAAAPPARAGTHSVRLTRTNLRGKLLLRVEHSGNSRQGYSRAEHHSTRGKARLEKPVVAGNERTLRDSSGPSRGVQCVCEGGGTCTRSDTAVPGRAGPPSPGYTPVRPLREDPHSRCPSAPLSGAGCPAPEGRKRAGIGEESRERGGAPQLWLPRASRRCQRSSAAPAAAGSRARAA